MPVDTQEIRDQVWECTAGLLADAEAAKTEARTAALNAVLFGDEAAARTACHAQGKAEALAAAVLAVRAMVLGSWEAAARSMSTAPPPEA